MRDETSVNPTPEEFIAQEFLTTINKISKEGTENVEIHSEGSQNLEDHQGIEENSRKREYKESIDYFLSVFPNEDLKILLVQIRDDEQIFKVNDKMFLYTYLILSILKFFKIPSELILDNISTNEKIIQYSISLVKVVMNYTEVLTELFITIFIQNFKEETRSIITYIENTKYAKNDFLVQFVKGNKQRYSYKDYVFVLLSKFLSESTDKELKTFVTKLGEVELNADQIPMNDDYKEIFQYNENYLNFQKTVLHIGTTNRDIFTDIINNFNKSVKQELRN